MLIIIENMPLEKILKIHAKLRDQIIERSPQLTNLENSLFGFILLKSFNYCFNTYKGIGLLLPKLYYEQASLLLRAFWECNLTLHYIERSPEDRSAQFAEYSLIDFVKTLPKEERKQFEAAFHNRLRKYEIASKPNRSCAKYAKTWSGLDLKSMADELSDPWPFEYSKIYRLASQYTHGAPGAILIANEGFNGDFSKVIDHDKKRSAVVAISSIDIMIRLCRLIGKYSENKDTAFLQDIESSHACALRNGDCSS